MEESKPKPPVIIEKRWKTHTPPTLTPSTDLLSLYSLTPLYHQFVRPPSTTSLLAPLREIAPGVKGIIPELTGDSDPTSPFPSLMPLLDGTCPESLKSMRVERLDAGRVREAVGKCSQAGMETYYDTTSTSKPHKRPASVDLTEQQPLSKSQKRKEREKASKLSSHLSNQTAPPSLPSQAVPLGFFPPTAYSGGGETPSPGESGSPGTPGSTGAGKGLKVKLSLLKRTGSQ